MPSVLHSGLLLKRKRKNVERERESPQKNEIQSVMRVTLNKNKGGEEKFDQVGVLVSGYYSPKQFPSLSLFLHGNYRFEVTFQFACLFSTAINLAEKSSGLLYRRWRESIFDPIIHQLFPGLLCSLFSAPARTSTCCN